MAMKLIKKILDTSFSMLVGAMLIVAISPAFAAYLTGVDAEMYQDDNAIATTINTVNVWEEVGNFVQGDIVGWTFTNGGHLTANAGSGGEYDLTTSISAQIASTNKTFEFAVSINDIIQDKCTIERRFSTNDVGAIPMTCLLNISDGDVIKMEVRNLTDNADITFIHVNFAVHQI
jgi:hypothetical protein